MENLQFGDYAVIKFLANFEKLVKTDTLLEMKCQFCVHMLQEWIL